MQRKPTKKWWRAYDGLYGNAKTPPDDQKQPVAARSQLPLPIDMGKPKKPVKTKPKQDTEVKEQIVSALWLDKMKIPFYHVPNGGYRNPIEAVKFKRMGVKAGVPDICIPLARKGYHGLYIELKRKSGGKLSEHQLYWRELLIKEGHAWFEAKGADHLKQIVMEYLNAK